MGVWSTLTGSLEALVVGHDFIGSLLREELGAGPPASQIEATIRGLGLTPPSELIEFFAWHDLEARPGSAGRIDWFWPVGGFRLEEAVSEYLQSVEIGGTTPDEIGDELPPDANRHSARIPGSGGPTGSRSSAASRPMRSSALVAGGAQGRPGG